MSKCHRGKTIAHGLSLYVERSIGNQGKTFLKSWNENLQTLSVRLMLQVITFCDQTINKVNEEIEKAKAELHGKPDRNEREEIISTLEKNDELSRKKIHFSHVTKSRIFKNLDLRRKADHKFCAIC